MTPPQIVEQLEDRLFDLATLIYRVVRSAWRSTCSRSVQLTASGHSLAQRTQIDFDESLPAKRIVIKPGVDDNLDSIKRTYYGLGDFLVRHANAAPHVQWSSQLSAASLAPGAPSALCSPPWPRRSARRFRPRLRRRWPSCTGRSWAT